MKKILLLICVSFIFFPVFSQSTFDKSLNEVSTDISGKLSQKNKKRIVVLYITDINKAQTVAGKYMADVISVNIVNDEGNFEVFDRENLSGIVEANRMMEAGVIDANKAKELGKILAVDAIVIGNYTVLTTTLKLSLKALDVNSGFVIAASMKDLPITADAGALLGVPGITGGDYTSNKGFNNRPLNSNESYNNPQTVNSDCQKNKTGDYCFQNSTNLVITVRLWPRGIHNAKEMRLDPGQTQCFYDLIIGSAEYTISEGWNNQRSIGQVNIEQCKSKTFAIK